MAVNSVTPAQQDAIAGLYAAFWNRAPDTTGFGFWVEKLSTGKATLDQIATEFRNAPEGKAEYPLWSTNEELVTEVYVNVFGRQPDAPGLAFWTAKLSTGQATFPELVVDMVEAAETNGSNDGLLFTNKVIVGVYVATVAQTDNGYVCDNAFNQVTYEASSVATAEAWVDANNTGATYTLTTNIDTVNVEGHGVNTVVGVDQVVAASTAGTTWNTGDTINGNGLTKISLIENGATGANIVDANNIASIDVNLAATSTLNETEFNDVAQIAIVNGTSGTALTVSAHDLATTLAVQKNREYDVTVGSYADVSGKTDTVALSVANAGTSATNFTDGYVLFDLSVGNAIEAVTLATSGTNYVSINAGTGAAKIAVTGSGTNDILIVNAASTNAIDLSATTGTNNLDIGTLISSAETVTGGSGEDTLVAELDTTGQHLPTVSGVENLEISFSAAGTINASKITGATSLDVSGSTAASTFSNLSADVETLSTIVTNGANNVTFGYASKSAAVVDYNVGGKAAVANNATTFSNVADLTINAAGKSTSSLGNLAAGTAATALTLTTAAAANDLTVGTLTAAKLTSVAVAAGAGDVTVGAFTTAALTSIDVTSTGGAVTLTAAGLAATTFESLDVNVSGGADVAVAAAGITAHAAQVSSFNTLSVVAGDDSTITVGAINAGKGADAANITTYDVTLGAHTAADTSAIGSLTAYTVGDINVTVGAASAASTLSLNTIAATEVGNITVAVGTNETVSLTNDDTSADGITVGDITATGAGAFNYTLNSTTGAGTVGAVDASGLTGVATINLSGATNGTTLTGGSKGDTLGGTTGDDIIQGNAGADSLTGNGGSDVFNYTAWSQTGITAGTADTIVDFATANDLIDVTTSAGTASNYDDLDGSLLADFAAAKTAAQAVLNGTIKYVVVYDLSNSGNGVLFYGDASGVATNAIQLTGIGATGDFAYSNII